MVNTSLTDISPKDLNIDPNVKVSQKHINQLFSGIQPLLAKLQENATPPPASKKPLTKGICHPHDPNNDTYGSNSLPCLPWKNASDDVPKKPSYSCTNCEIMAVKKNLGMQYTTDKLFPTICPSRGNTEQCAAAGGQWGLSQTITDSQDQLAYCKNPPSAEMCREKCKEIRECKYYSVDTKKDQRCVLFTSCDQPTSSSPYESYTSYAYTDEEEEERDSDGGQIEANLREAQAKKDIKKIIKLLTNNFDDKMDEVNEKIKNYKMQIIGQKHTSQLKDNYGRDINQVESNITSLTNENNINDRLAYYYDNQNTSITGYVKFFKILYWVLLAIYICYFIAYKGLIKNRIFAIAGVALSLLPFILKAIINEIYPNKIKTPPRSYSCPTTPPSTVVKPKPKPSPVIPSWTPPAPEEDPDRCKPPTLMNALRNIF